MPNPLDYASPPPKADLRSNQRWIVLLFLSFLVGFACFANGVLTGVNAFYFPNDPSLPVAEVACYFFAFLCLLLVIFSTYKLFSLRRSK